MRERGVESRVMLPYMVIMGVEWENKAPSRLAVMYCAHKSPDFPCPSQTAKRCWSGTPFSS